MPISGASLRLNCFLSVRRRGCAPKDCTNVLMASSVLLRSIMVPVYGQDRAVFLVFARGHLFQRRTFNEFQINNPRQNNEEEYSQSQADKNYADAHPFIEHTLSQIDYLLRFRGSHIIIFPGQALEAGQGFQVG